MIRRRLSANRGEIAIRVARTAREMGIRAIGVFSDADREALHRRAMDESHEIGGAAPAEGYLNIGRTPRAGKAPRADAVPPGYGFLSENATFARRCEEAGVAFVGPPPRAVAVAGAKSAAR